MYIGVDYYPEHWPKARWATDARLMQEAGFNVVRLAEFAWAFMEPEEGRFEFGWLDEALEILGKHGISVILGTPTAAMPAWVARRYPEVMAVEKDGQRKVWGVRKNNCFSSGAYKLLSERITRAMAEHYAATPNVIGWQTDNEFGHPVCYCANCRTQFHDWLRTRYGTLAELNRAWGTHFWGACFGEWAEIPLPVDNGTHNPSLCLDFQRFFSWQNVVFQADQVRILRACCPKQFITHNFMGLFSELNYYDLAADLDHVSWDNYPVWNNLAIPYDSSLAADVMRGLKRKNFWIMEQTAGPGGWGSFGRNPRPGEIRKVTFQQVAHGADHIVWFRWRTCTAGREQYWHGLLGHDGRPLRRYREAAQTATDLRKLESSLAGTTVKADVAMVFDYESFWAVRIQPGFAANNFHEAVKRWYKALSRAGINVDVVKPGADLSGYKAVFAPDLHVLPDALARQLSEYVARGGVLVSDCRTGVKDETNLCHDRTLPGLLSDALGIAIEEYEAIGDEMSYAVTGQGAGLRGAFIGKNYSDWVTPVTAEALAGYGDWYLKAFAAATRNRYRKGTAYYVGTVMKEEAFYDALVVDILKTAKVTAPAKPPVGVEASIRAGQGRELLFLVNHTEERQTVAVPAGKKEVLTGRKTGKSLELGAYEVAVVRLK